MINDGNNEVDIVCAGLVIMIIGLLLIQCAPILSDISYFPGEKTIYEDKTTRFPDYIAPHTFIIMGIFAIIIGCAVFLRNFINQCLNRSSNQKSHPVSLGDGMKRMASGTKPGYLR